MHLIPVVLDFHTEEEHSACSHCGYDSDDDNVPYGWQEHLSKTYQVTFSISSSFRINDELYSNLIKYLKSENVNWESVFELNIKANKFFHKYSPTFESLKELCINSNNTLTSLSVNLSDLKHELQEACQ